MDLCDKSSWIGKLSRSDVNSFVPDSSMYKKNSKFPQRQKLRINKTGHDKRHILFFSAMSPKVMNDSRRNYWIKQSETE